MPGIYELETRRNDGLYVVDTKVCAGVISEAALEYGVPYEDGVWRYFDYDHGRFVLQYEIVNVQLKTCLPEQEEDLRQERSEIAAFGAEKYASYFGDWKPQRMTPWGEYTRYLEAGQGTWFVRVGDSWYFSLCFVLYDALSKEARKDAKSNPGENPALTFADMYWELETCAPAVFTALEDAPGLEEYLTSEEDLACCLCERFPEFVEWYNGKIDGVIRVLRGENPHRDVSRFTTQRIVKLTGTSPNFLDLPD